MAKIPGIENPRVELQIEESAIEVKVDVDRAAQYGLKPGDVRRATSAMVGGITVGALFEEQKVFDVVVWGRPEMRGNIDDLRNLMISSENGSQVHLAQVADVRIAPATSIIRRQGSSRRVDVLAQVDGGRLGMWRMTSPRASGRSHSRSNTTPRYWANIKNSVLPCDQFTAIWRRRRC
jgi:Cu/Ag efflux pump CusA